MKTASDIRLLLPLMGAASALAMLPAGAQQNFPSGLTLGSNPDTQFYSWHANSKTGTSLASPQGGMILYAGRSETSRSQFDGGVTLYGKPLSLVLGADNDSSGGNTGTFDVWRDDDYWSTTGGLQPVFRIDTANNVAKFDSVNVTISNGTLSVAGSPAITSSTAPSVLGGLGFLQLSGGTVGVSATTASTSSATGAFTVAGGLGVQLDSYISGVRIGRGAAGIASNTVFGGGGLDANTTGSNNTALGFGALGSNTTGSYNVALGFDNLSHNLGGSNNVAIGNGAGSYLADGTSLLTGSEGNIYLGAGARATSNSDSNSIVIGTSAVSEGANTTVIGNTSTVSTRLHGETLTTALSVDGETASGSLTVEGPTVLNGTVTLSQPQGDISMGDYGN